MGQRSTKTTQSVTKKLLGMKEKEMMTIIKNPETIRSLQELERMLMSWLARDNLEKKREFLIDRRKENRKMIVNILISL